jgi:hypothetical protein
MVDMMRWSLELGGRRIGRPITRGSVATAVRMRLTTVTGES